MDIIFSDDFKKEYSKIRDKTTRIRIINSIKKISDKPDIGKPLRYGLKGYRSLRIPPYRIIYRIDSGKIIINCFDHRKEVYQQ